MYQRTDTAVIRARRERRAVMRWLDVAMACSVISACLLLAPPTARSEDAAIMAQIAAADPLWDKRTGVSEQEPNYCAPTITRETNINAANRNSIEVGPPKFLVDDLGDGRVWRHCISVLNRYDAPRTIELSTLDLVGSLDPNVTIETRDDPKAMGTWIQLPIDRFTLQPGERALVPYLLTLPESPPGGTNIGGIRVSDVTVADGASAGAQISKSLVTQLQVTSPGGEARPIKVRDIRSTRFIWTNRDPSVLSVRYTVTNEGSVVDIVTPTLETYGLFGRRVGVVKGAPDVIVPNSTQRASIRWNPVPFIGVYNPKLVITSADGTTTIDLPRTWVLPPWPYVIGFFLALLALGFGIWRRRRNDWQQYLDDDDDAWDEDFPADDPYGETYGQ